MTISAFLLFAVCAIALLTVKRQYAPIALLVGCCYVTIGQGILVAGVNLPIYRLLLMVGVVRCVIKGETLKGGLNPADKILIFWSVWCVFASCFHDQKAGAGVIYTFGSVANVSLTYFLGRTWCGTVEELRNFSKAVAIILVPIAAEMIYEKIRLHNAFSIFGGVPEMPAYRNGSFRAQGPFRHAILAGTVGAVCLPLVMGIFKTHKIVSIVGSAACVAIVFASASSGPLMSMAAGFGFLGIWKFRQHIPSIIWASIGLYLLLWVVMAKPPYFLIGRIDLVGGSTGYHRALLIDATIRHFGEWFLFGTDVTRHWMPGQGAISETQTDITSYYVGFAVLGGIACLWSVLAIMWKSFRYAYSFVMSREHIRIDDRFFSWCIMAGMFAHAVTSLSVAYFDQSSVFFWLNLAMLSSFYKRTDPKRRPQKNLNSSDTLKGVSP